MPRPLPAELVASDHTALVVVECMNSVLGPVSTLPALADAARDHVVPNIARLIAAAHDVGVPVVHCTIAFRSDGRGANRNAPLFQRGPGGIERPARAGPGGAVADPTGVIDALRPTEDDIVLQRVRGVGPMGSTDLDGVLRNLGATTIVAVGVSVNVAVTNLVMDAVNLGYDVVLPRDAVAGVPPEYADAVIRNTLSLLTALTTTDDLVAAWLP